MITSPSPVAYAIIRDWEQLRLQAYLDDKYGKVWTIGYGHTKGVKEGDTCTVEQAEQWLIEDVTPVVNELNQYPGWGLSQCEYDALTSFIFNIGAHQFETSTMKKLLVAGSPRIAIAYQFMRWVYDNGVLMPGLRNRRNAERTVFLGGSYVPRNS